MGFLNPKVKGSVGVGQGDGFIALPVGSDGQVLAADSTAAEGLKWVPQVTREAFQFGLNSQVTAGGTVQLEGPGNTDQGVVAFRSGTITAASIGVNTADGGNDYELDIRINGVSVATVPLLIGNTAAFTSALTAAVVAGDVITVFMNRTSGAGGSAFNNQAAAIEITL